IMIGVLCLKPYAVRSDPIRRHLSHEGDHCARIDPATQESSERNDADHLIAHRVPQERPQFFAALAETLRPVRLFKFYIPILCERHLIILGNESPTRGQFLNPLK